jgi:arylsulfatase
MSIYRIKTSKLVVKRTTSMSCKPNILLVIWDSVRAKNVSLHGHFRDTTPFLHSFAEQATVYEQARSPSNWSLPSHTSIFTGLHLAEHGYNDTKDGQLEPGHTIWEELANEHGYETGIFSENPYLSSYETGLSRGFGTVVGPPPRYPFPEAFNPGDLPQPLDTNKYLSYIQGVLDSESPLRSLANGASRVLPYETTSEDGGYYYLDAFEEWVTNVTEPWACCINFMDAHVPFQASEDHDCWGDAILHNFQDRNHPNMEYIVGDQSPWQHAALEALYDGAIRQLDALLAGVVDILERLSSLDDTLVVVTSDHGEGFCEPDELWPSERIIGHSPWSLNEELLHVPLIVRYPSETDGTVVEEPASLTQFPTVVRSVVEEACQRKGFVPEGDVLAGAAGMTEAEYQKYAGRTDDPARFRRTGKVVYNFNGKYTIKHMELADRSAVFEISDPQYRRKVVDANETSLNSSFDGVNSVSVIQQISDGISQESRERLERLGYVE